MTLDLPPVTVLHGPHLDLVPLTDALAAALWRPEVFAGGWGGGPAAYPASGDAMTGFLKRFLTADRVFVVIGAQGPLAGQVVGTTSLGEFETAKERCHLGWTAYDPRVWGTVVNPECKLLLLGHAFDHGWGRVRIQADSINERSRAAIAKLGATFEGITRRDQLRADGSWRDAALFSVIIEDWPAVKVGLEARVARESVPFADR
ncbi:MAG TPA: GNAT family protein [Propionibacteriaceae bacterium]|nr:GNAT family protein [Propionibacteriaceae bacterium]